MARFSILTLAQLVLSAAGAHAALKVDVDDTTSVEKAAAYVAEELMDFYTRNNEIPGLLPGPPPDGDYYQWTGAALWAAILDYGIFTGDRQYADKASEGILWQRGSNDFLAVNWTASAGNDDQALWGLTALAAERGIGETGVDDLEWVNLAQNVFDEQSSEIRRVVNGSCEGALRWQLFSTNSGYNYIPTLANVAYANLAAHLSLLDGHNKTQADAVEATFDFLQGAEFIDSKFNVFDGAVAPDCDNVNKVQFSAPAALALESAAVMFNSTGGDEKWKKLVDGLAQRTVDVFFPDGVATEIACEPDNCNTDQTFYLSFLYRSLATTVRVAPHTAGIIVPVLKTGAAAAVESCPGGSKKESWCGLVSSNKSDAQTGAGYQISVLSALLSVLAVENMAVEAPSSGNNGNSDSSDDSSGNSDDNSGNNNNSGNDNNNEDNKDNNDAESNVPQSAGAHAGVSFIALLGSVLIASLAI